MAEANVEVPTPSDEAGTEDLEQKNTDVTSSTQASDEDEAQQQQHDTAKNIEDVISGLDGGEDILPEDEDLNSSDIMENPFVSSNSDFAEVNKAEVRKSILKGKSELSRSRQKNNALKAIQPEFSSLHSPFAGKPQTRPAASNRKPFSSNHGPPITEPPKPQNPLRSFSHDDIAGLATAKPGRLTHSQSLANEDANRSNSRRASIATLAKAPIPAGSLTRTKRASTTSVELPSFCTPKRAVENKLLNVDNAIMMALAAPPSVAPTRKPPGRSKSANVQRIGMGRKRNPPQRTSSFDGATSPDGFPRHPRRVKSFEKKEQGGGGEMSIAAIAAHVNSLQGGKLGSENSNSSDNGTATNSQVQKNQEQLQLKSKHNSPRDADEADTKPKNPGPISLGQSHSKDTTDKSVSKSARQSSHSANSSHAPSSGEEDLVMMWSCWACEYDYNLAENVFCGMCGTGRDWHCPSCEHDNKSSFNFCGMCGTRKGRVILNRTQPEGFNMRMHKRAKKRPLKKISNGRTQKAPGSPGKSVASAKSSSRRSSAMPRSKLVTDEMSAASEQLSQARRTSSVDGMSTSDGITRTKSGDSCGHGEKRSSRGRGRDSKQRESKRGESTTRKKRGARSTSRVGKDGKERRRGDEKKKKDKSKRKSVRRPRNACSVPPNERPGEYKTRDKAPAKPAMKRTTSESKLNLGLEKPKPRSSNPQGGATEGNNSRSSVVSAGNLPGSAIDGNNTCGSATSASNLRGSAADGNNQGGSTTKGAADVLGAAADVLTTPNIKKQLLKIGKIGKAGGKLLFSKGDEGEARSAEVSITRSASGDLLDSQHFQKRSQHGINPEITTPSLKQRFLGTVGWSKSDKGKSPPAIPNVDEPPPEAEPIEQKASQEDEESPDEDLFVGLSQGLIVTAKDMRPNRPQISRRKPNPNKRRGSHSDPQNDAPTERRGGRERRRSSKRRGSGVSVGRRESDSSSANSVKQVGSTSEADDALGDMSEAESIDSLDFQ